MLVEKEKLCRFQETGKDGWGCRMLFAGKSVGKPGWTAEGTGSHEHLGSGSAKRSEFEVISLVFMAFAVQIGFALGLFTGDASLLDELEFLDVLQELA